MATPRFDLRALFEALSAERERQRLSWADLGRQVGVSPSTIRRFDTAADAEADGVLASLRWLEATPEDFIRNGRATGTRLPSTGEGHVRVDMPSMASADGTALNGRTRTTIQRLVATADRVGQPISSLTRLTEI